MWQIVLKYKKRGTDVKTEVIENNVPNKFTNSYNGVQIKNESDLEFTDEMLNFDFNFDNNWR